MASLKNYIYRNFNQDQIKDYIKEFSGNPKCFSLSNHNRRSADLEGVGELSISSPQDFQIQNIYKSIQGPSPFPLRNSPVGQLQLYYRRYNCLKSDIRFFNLEIIACIYSDRHDDTQVLCGPCIFSPQITVPQKQLT